MSIFYNYVLDEFLNNRVNIDKLVYEIGESSISGILLFITTSSNDCDIYFENSLSSADEITLNGVVATHDGEPIPSVDDYYSSAAVVTDPYTTISGIFLPMQIFVLRRDLYNDTENPLYVPGHIPLLGISGSVPAVANRVNNVEEAISDDGWYTKYIKSWTYPSPHNLLIYYGWLNSFNYSTNQWSNEKIAQDMAKYSVLVFGDGIQNPAHDDYANTQVIIPRVKALNQYAKVFGYVTANQSVADFKTKVDQWDGLHIDGIFIDEAGYDYGVDRSKFNELVDYVHGKTYANICFANCWNMDHIIGTTNDTSYPNSTYNPDLEESNLSSGDWYLLESFPVNTSSYEGGYESKVNWNARAVKADTHRYNYGINLAAVSKIDNATDDGQELFDFSFISAMMWNLDAHGSSDTLYGASSATVVMWKRPRTDGLGREWSESPSVQPDAADADVFHRYLDYGRLFIDFSTGAQTCGIEKFTPDELTIVKFGPANLSKGTTQAPIKTTSSGNPITGLGFSDAEEESMYGVFEVPLKWKRGTSINVKLLYFNDYAQSGTKVCRWALDYQVYETLEKIADKTTTTLTVNHELPENVAADTLMEASMVMPYNDSNNPLSRGSIVPFRIYRDCTDDADTMENDAVFFILTFECESEVV